MIKNFDNITVKSKYSDNYYDSFQVNTALNEIYFIQRDARRNGQVARCFTVSVNEINNDVLIEAYSADSGRYEQFVRTQCLELALQLLEEAKAELRHINEVNNVNNKAHETKTQCFKLARQLLDESKSKAHETKTQCLELAHQLLDESKSKIKPVNEVNKVTKMMKNAKVSISKILSNTKAFVSELLFGKDCLYEDELKKYKKMKHQK